MDKEITNMPSLPQRRSLRLSGYDYSQAGAYFVTLCVERRSTLFGEIVGGEMQLNNAGRMVEQAWLELPKHYPGVKVDICQLMPDHFHSIIWLDNMTDKEISPLTLSDIIQRFKSLTTHLYIEGVAKEGWQKFPGRLWQRGFFDHVIRNEDDLEDTRNYIVNNPQNRQLHRQKRTQECKSVERETVKCPESGFTLVEMIVVIVIVGILAVLGGRFIVAPVTGYVDLARRTRLVDQAEMALRRMQRDIRHALPNSIRIDGTNRYLEMLNTLDGGRYRRYQDPGVGGDDILDFTVADTGFDILGLLSQVPTAGNRLVVYNISSTGPTGNAYANPPDNTGIIGGGSPLPLDHITLNPGFNFANTSPNQRFFIVDQPVTYACENGVLNRYDGYAIAPIQQTPPAVAADLVTRGVTGCAFSYAPGTSQRAGLVTLRITLAEEGEEITLLHQVHVVNVP